MYHYIYMIKSIKNGKIKTYVGYSNNLKKRLAAHNSGKGAKSTRGRMWKIIFKRKFLSKSSALKAEYFLKKNKLIRGKIKNGFNFKGSLCI